MTYEKGCFRLMAPPPTVQAEKAKVELLQHQRDEAMESVHHMKVWE